MTIIEVMFAIVILSGVMLAMSRFGQAFTRAARDSAVVALASDLAAARLERVRAHPTYTTLVETFHNSTETSTGASDPSMAGYAGFTRRTQVGRTRTSTLDYTIVTVTITSPELKRPIVKSIYLAADL